MLKTSSSEALSITTLLCAAGSLAAQNAETKPAEETKSTTKPTDLKEVVIEASVYNPKRMQSPKFTEPARNIPQTLSIIPRQVIEDRGAFTLRDVLKNTPGISMQAGEGISGHSGADSLAIRGFSSRSDWFVDGIRDYGNYNRDPWNMEQVEVAKGPASTTMGRGSTGGYINTVSKMANLQESTVINSTVGTSSLYRGTVDTNQKLGDHSALRLNGMWNSNDVAGRDNIFQSRYGIGASLALGLETDTRFTLNYMRQEENNLPDFGLPFVPTNGTFVGGYAYLNSFANQIAPVSFDTSYARRNYDFQKIQTDMITAIFEHDFSKSLRFRNTTRWARNHYDARTAAPRFIDTDTATPGNQYTSQLVLEDQRRRQTNSSFTNQSLLNADFDTGRLHHGLVMGLEFAYEQQLTASRAGNVIVSDLFDSSVRGALTPGQQAANPRRTTTIQGVSPTDLPAAAESHLSTVSVYAMDTVKLGKHWQLSGGIRYDHIHFVQHGYYYTGANDIFGGSNPGPTNNDDLFSWKGALVYKPVDHGSFYFGYATSYNATADGGNSGQLGLTIPGGAGGIGNNTFAGFNPEKATSYELGTKWDLFKERLSLTAALFRTEKTNVRTTNANITTNAGSQTVDGVEIGLAGQLTSRWQVFAGATHMASKVNASSTAAELGQMLPNAPDYTFNLWTTYNITDNLQIGGGTQYMGKIIGSSGNASRVIPDYWTTDLMVSYRFTQNFSLRLNIYNVADNRYLDTVSSTGSATPGMGRYAALTASIKF
ncbi:TonB-dependent receptor [Prosthecobacter vanneervenii]|uniref:Catecholate siderophore receptor n=1 Tax=Prosthecobacter vanneervenii TaxID=48466 RepID=A0A7W7YGS3_9BACT|nr:TonB-dependent siderophore receptor [Prosthecobacter vanneervenii]MBB5035580.1 catecholate siderophore receptor [Prosthecobacter vanneervenii]